VFVTFLDPDVVERPSDVEFGEVLGGLDLVEHVGDERQWPAVLDCLRIDVPVVLCWLSASVLLGYEEEGTGDETWTGG